MSNTLKSLCACIVVVLFCSLVGAQSTNSTASAVVPQLVRFSGKAVDEQGKPVSGIVGLTFAIYNSQQGGAPLWMETQNVTADAKGNYTVQLGAASAQGLPLDLFSSGEARWVGVRISGGEEQPRVLLLSVPYALKAADAQTLGGLPSSAFVLAGPPNSTPSTASTPAPNPGGDATPGITGSGKANYIPIWTSGSKLGNSVLFQSGKGATAQVGIGTTTPASTLDVNGTGTIRGLFGLPSTGTATATQGYNSQPTEQTASSYNSGAGAAVNQNFLWQAEPTGNDTNNTSATLNLLFGAGGNKPAETGLNIASNGQITFATGQTFPGTGSITGVTAGSDLTGGGSSGNVTLNLDTTKVPLLGAANTFTASQTVNGTMTATTFSGSGSALTNVNAASLNGLTASAFGQLAASNLYQSSPLGTTIPQVLAPVNNATTSGGFSSNPLDLAASSYNSGAGAAQNETFRWQAEAAGNNTGSPSGTLNLLFGANGAAPTETGLNIANNGQVTFAKGQSFPGAGTVTSVGSGAGLTGGPITGSGSLSIATGGVTNAMLVNPSLTVTAGTALTGGGAVPLGGSTTLNVDTTQVPLLAANNTFTGNQIVNANLSASSISAGPMSATASGSAAAVTATDLSTTGVGGVIASSSTGTGVYSTGGSYGVYGDSSYTGVRGTGGSYGVYGNASSIGVYGTGATGVYASGSTTGVYGTAPTGVYGYGSTSGVSGQGGNYGVWGSGVTGVYGAGDSSGVYGSGSGSGSVGVNGYGYSYGLIAGASSDGWAGWFNGNVDVDGKLSKAGGSFKIDHPLDPANKYLYHSFVESPDMMNIYNGNVTTDAQGNAVVHLPEWFETLNRDFRYQLTVIGQFAQAIVATEIAEGRFSIKTDKPNVKVSWQVTGIRQDAWANANRIPVEEEKPEVERGFYLHPALYGAPEEKGILWARAPKAMQQWKEARAKAATGNGIQLPALPELPAKPGIERPQPLPVPPVRKSSSMKKPL
jgi:trimeric autotransporter adhesin